MSAISITGIGIVSAIGLNQTEVLQSLIAERSGIGAVSYLPTVHTELPVGEVKLSNDEMKLRLGLPVEQDVSRTSLMAMLAIREALEQAGVGAGKRVALVSGTTVGGMDITEQHFIRNRGGQSDDTSFMLTHDAGRCSEQIAEYFGIFDEVTTISTACSSAANAIIVGAEMLRNGEAEIVVAGGSEALSLFHLNGFHSLMILDHEQCRPFSGDRAGLNLGEGAGYVVMMRDEADSKPLAYLTGYGNACDAFHQTATSADGEGAYRAMQLALEMSGLERGDIQYVNAHGTGTPNNDASESVALQRLFGDNLPAVSSTKSFTGHTTSASGSIETIICILAMQHGFVPANLAWREQMPDAITPEVHNKPCVLKHVMCNSFGFGGNDSSLILSLNPKGINETTKQRSNETTIIAESEVTTEEQLAEIKSYVKPLEARRMGKLMKASLLTSLRVLEQAGVSVPDAIVTATAYGCVENSEKILLQLTAEGETSVSPTLFMQSTHNTISSNIAIRLGCHGYNITYTQSDSSLDWAMREAKRLLASGLYKTVLVGYHDESTPLFNQLMQSAGLPAVASVYSKSLLLTCK